MTHPSVRSPGRWLQPAETGMDAAARLFLFHYAGGGASVYRDWLPLLPADVAAQCVQLPGRQERRGEGAFTEIEPLVDALEEALGAELDERPYSFFGHCMGALLAYRVAVAAERRGGVGPVLLGLSGWAPVGFHTVPPEQADLPEDEVLAWARGLGSLPPEISEDRETLALVLPAMRTDLAVCASYVDDGASVTCPVVTYSGKWDPLMEPGAMACWSERSPAYLGNSEFQGGHFFLHERGVAITTDFVRRLRRLLGQPQGAPA